MYQADFVARYLHRVYRCPDAWETNSPSTGTKAHWWRQQQAAVLAVRETQAIKHTVIAGWWQGRLITHANNSKMISNAQQARTTARSVERVVLDLQLYDFTPDLVPALLHAA